MLKNFKIHVETNFSFLKENKLLIAISGGVDSVVLAYLCHSLKLDFVLAHCNFNLRGEESDTDEEFVIQLGESLDIETFVQKFDTQIYADLHKVSIQMAARELRYNWFQDLAKELDFDYILTAHQADDNLETFLINFTRGTGLNGLTGIPPLNDNIVRPLLPFSREVILEYAKKNNIKWREDSSNSSRKYLRNKLRHEVVPILKDINPQLLDSFQNTLENLNDTADIVDESLNAVAKRAIVDINENEVTYKVSEFKKVNNPKAYLFEMFKDFGFTEWDNVVHLLDAETGKYVESNTHRLTKHRDVFILQNLEEDSDSELVSESYEIEELKDFDTPIGLLNFKKVDKRENNTPKNIYIDADKLKFPLTLRRWRKIDVFQPIGMIGKKKLSKYLKDEKLTQMKKTSTWVLLSKGNIVWVIGYRADGRFGVNDNTQSILRITFDSKQSH